MKKLTVGMGVMWLMVAFTFASEPLTKRTVKPIDMDKAMFLERVFDYESGDLNEWRYLGDKPAIVDFHADWCGPCLVTNPILKELAAEYGDELYVYKVDVDEQRELARVFGAYSLPMFLFIPMDELPQVGAGALPKAAFREVIEDFLLKE